jgi:hypothetical protein
MLYYILRMPEKHREPLAIFRLATEYKDHGHTDITGLNADRIYLQYSEFQNGGGLLPSKHGLYVKVMRRQEHIFSLYPGDNPNVVRALNNIGLPHDIERVSQAEWETFDAFDLFPILKVRPA